MESSVTCWSLVRAAAARKGAERAEFARRYAPVVRAFFGARWKGRPLAADLDDAVQEVFVDCFKAGGALERARPGAGRGFRAFLRGIARNVALRFEERARRRSRAGGPLDADEFEADDERLSRAFDRVWAQAVLRDAATRMAGAGPDSLRRVELLRLRFDEGIPIREIAQRWGSEPLSVHRAYARARREFRSALLEVVAFHHPGERDELEAECKKLLALFRR